MRTRIIVFTRFAEADNTLVLFGIAGRTLLHELTVGSLDEFAAANNLSRHPQFDWAAGDGGAKCALFEAPATHPEALPAVFAGLDRASTGNPLQNDYPAYSVDSQVAWLAFPGAVRLLPPGDDRRLLQLAVQYIAAGGVDESVIASDYDEEFLKHLSEALTKKEQNKKDVEPSNKES